MKHVHHDMIIEWAADPSRVVESRKFLHHEWTVDPHPKWLPTWQYRFKPAEPKYIVVNGVNVPEPVRERLKAGQPYWLVDPSNETPIVLNWHDNSQTKQWLSLGLIHLTREAAQTHIDAMLLPSRTDK